MYVNVPGLHNSDFDHWQSHLERSYPDQFIRIQQENWDQPDCQTWIDQIEDQLNGYEYKDLILIGHSIGCMAIVKWIEKYNHSIKGALFVAPSDSEKESYPEYIRGFIPIPIRKLPFPSFLVASANDHVTSIDRSEKFASDWGSELIILQDAGHIESKSGFGEWTLAKKLIEELSNLHH